MKKDYKQISQQYFILIAYWSDNIFDILGRIKYIIEINFNCLFLSFKDVTTRKLYITYVAQIVFLLDSAALDCSFVMQ